MEIMTRLTDKEFSQKKLEEYALGVCLFYNISRTATFKDYPKKEANLLYNYFYDYNAIGI